MLQRPCSRSFENVPVCSGLSDHMDRADTPNLSFPPAWSTKILRPPSTQRKGFVAPVTATGGVSLGGFCKSWDSHQQSVELPRHPQLIRQGLEREDKSLRHLTAAEEKEQSKSTPSEQVVEQERAKKLGEISEQRTTGEENKKKRRKRSVV